MPTAARWYCRLLFWKWAHCFVTVSGWRWGRSAKSGGLRETSCPKSRSLLSSAASQGAGAAVPSVREAARSCEFPSPLHRGGHHLGGEVLFPTWNPCQAIVMAFFGRPLWESAFSVVPVELSSEEKATFLTQLGGVALSSDAFFPFRLVIGQNYLRLNL